MSKKRSARLFLQDILDCITLIREYLDGMSRDEFEDDMVVKDAVERRIEIIAEATKHVPEKLKAAHPEILWKSVVSMRNFLSHEYFAVVNESVWNVVQNHLGPLETAVTAMLAELSDEEE